MTRPRFLLSLLRWVDSYAGLDEMASRPPDRVDWVRVLPFIAIHLACLGVIWVGWSWTAVWVAVGLYAVRILAITAGYHRYFSHQSYRMGRVPQFVMAVLGNMAVQRGPLWWAAHHRHHHRFADQPEDPHSPIQHGFLWSHVLWFCTPRNFPTRQELVKGWRKYPELVFLDRFNVLVPLLLLGSLYGIGEWLRVAAPSLGTSGLQLAVWGFAISTVATFHGTATINSLDHLIGRRRYDTTDHSRNNWLLALLTFGEGWHNNHHRYPPAVRQGHRWWEIDLTYCLLVVLSWLRVVRDLRRVPQEVLDSASGGADAAASPDPREHSPNDP